MPTAYSRVQLANTARKVNVPGAAALPREPQGLGRGGLDRARAALGVVDR